MGTAKRKRVSTELTKRNIKMELVLVPREFISFLRPEKNAMGVYSILREYGKVGGWGFRSLHRDKV
jgi:hypothetical protein